MTEIKTYENISIVTYSNIQNGNTFLCDVLKLVAAGGINVDMISLTPHTSDRMSFGFSFDDDDVAKLLLVTNTINSKFKITPLVSSSNVKIVVKSEKMENQAGFASSVFSALNDIGATPLLITTGVDEISVLATEAYSDEVIKKLNKLFL